MGQCDQTYGQVDWSNQTHRIILVHIKIDRYSYNDPCAYDLECGSARHMEHYWILNK